MMLPWRGFVRGTQTTTCAPCSAATFSLIRASSGAPPRVSLATTRMVLATRVLLFGRGRRVGARRCGDLRALEDAVHRSGDAVLVRAADDGRDVVEVE